MSAPDHPNTVKAPDAHHPVPSWLYRGLWRRLSAWFDVPREPPGIPIVAAPGADARAAPAPEQIHPDAAFLTYLRVGFSLVAALLLAASLVGVVFAFFEDAVAGLGVAAGVALLVLTPLLLVWIAIHLRYDTTWFVLTDRSLRVRRGVWVIREMTITFENVQNVRISQGPVERLFGIKRLKIDTAGSGGGSEGGGEGANDARSCILEGLADAERVRDLIMTRVRASRSAGLGDESDHTPDAEPARARLTAAQIDALRAIRDEAQSLSAAAASATASASTPSARDAR